ncbi:hypothetical protein DFH07DRAFT_389121 [Mycena maculata]|uniref:Uncharacterized protein n=1 Tax=Mycena maculata TaxID=230809 RepID=A0AAD7KCP3_9AGAR|nr:hypothetical protein DFH07DRAFT_389121 [Mycena maculata]
MPSRCIPFSSIRTRVGGTVKRSLRSLFNRSRRTHPVLHDHLVCWGVLGVEGTMEANNVDRMISDFGWWSFLLCHAPGYDDSRSSFHVLRSLKNFGPDGRGIHGEAACDRFRFPLHPSLLEPDHPPFSALDHRDAALIDLSKKASGMKAGETLLLLLIGHGSCDSTGVFHLWITTGLGLTGEASFTKEELELAVAGCKARVVVISNACQSGLLKCERWTPVCTAGPTQKSDALAQSASGYVQGSMVTQCTTAQIALDLGLQISQPRADKHSVTRQELHLDMDRIVGLPPSPPSHSFSSGTPPKIGSPTDRGIPEFIATADSNQEFLLFEPSPQDPELPQHQTPALLAGLAAAYAKLPRLAYTPEIRDYRSCVAYVQHLDAPDSVSSPLHHTEVDDFCSMLRDRNVQSVAVPHIARALGWWEGEVESFVVRPGGDYSAARSDMSERGMRVETMVEELCRQTSLSWMSPVERSPAVLWLLSKWPGAHTLSVSAESWTATVSQAVAATGDSNMLISI